MVLLCVLFRSSLLVSPSSFVLTYWSYKTFTGNNILTLTYRDPNSDTHEHANPAALT